VSSSSITVMGGVQVDVVIVPVGELPPPGQTLLVDEMSFRVGGAGANAAIAFAEAGKHVRLLGCVGDDHLGHWLIEELAAFGLGEDIAVLPARPTGLTVACQAPERDRTFLTFLGVNTAWEASMLPHDTTNCASLLVSDYFCAPALRGTATRELLGAARERDARTFLDTAWDPDGWQPDTRQEVLELLPYVDVFLPNEAEIMAIAPEHSSVEAAARALQALSGGWVVVKLGARGCFAVGPGASELRAPAEAVEVLDSTGAGDAFNAGLIAALSDGRDWPGALRAGTALAAAILARPLAERQRIAASRAGSS
jgi:sugar/nucleoside kinase (ribokinase family)